MIKKYTLSSATLKDIIDNVPVDKWGECLDELKVAIGQIAAVAKIVEFAGESLDMKKSECFEFPETIEWLDDGLKNNEVILSGPNGESESINFSLEGEKK